VSGACEHKEKVKSGTEKPCPVSSVFLHPGRSPRAICSQNGRSVSASLVTPGYTGFLGRGEA
jgi:hypothetical protein